MVLFILPFFVFSATITSTETGGNWTKKSTWVGGVKPTEIDDVIINGNVNDNKGAWSNPTRAKSVIVNSGKLLTVKYLEVKEVLNNGEIQGDLFVENKIENNGIFDTKVSLIGEDNHEVEILGTNNVDIAFKDGLDNIVLVGGDNINDISLYGGPSKKITFQNQKTLWEVNEIAGTPGEITLENLDKLKLKSLERVVLHSLNTEIEFLGGGKIGSFMEAKNIILESGSYECVPYGDVQYKVDNILVKSGVIFSSPNSIGSPPSPCIFTSEFENQGELKGFTAEMRGKFINNGIITKKETTDYEKISTKGEFINNGTLIPDQYNNHPIIDIYKSLENNSVVSDDLFFNIKSNGTEVEPVIIKGSIKPNINLSSEYDTYFLNGENNNLNFKKLRSYGDKFLNIPNQFNVFIEKLIAINDKIIFLNENNIELNGFDINTNDIEALNSNLTIRGGIFNGFEKEIKAKNIILENGNYSCGVLEASEDIMIKDSANITAGCSFKAQNLYNEGGFTGGQTSPETIDIDAFFVNSGIITGEYTSKLIINFYKDVFNVGTINTDTYSNINIYGNIENDSEFYIKNLNLFNESINIIGDVLIDGRIFLKQDTIFQEDIREIKAEIIDNGFSFAFLSSYIKINKLSNYSTIDKKILDLRFFSNLNIPNSDVIISHEVGQASYILGINNLKKLEVKNNVSVSSNTEINAEIIKIHNDGNNSYIGSDVIFNTKIINEGIMNSGNTYGGNNFYFQNDFQNTGKINDRLYAKFRFPDDVNIYEYKSSFDETIRESTISPAYSFNIYLNDTETPQMFYYRLKGDTEWIEVKLNYELTFSAISILTITLNGDENIVLYQNQDYTEFGADASDTIDGDITNNIQILGNVDTTTVGTYILTYSLTNSEGSTKTIQRTVKVQDLPDTTPPNMTLNGEEIITICQNDTYTEQGAISVDDVDGDITDNIEIVSDLDNTTINTYLISYTSTDNADNKSEITRTVEVVSKPATGKSRSTSGSKKIKKEKEKLESEQKKLEDRKEELEKNTQQASIFFAVERKKQVDELAEKINILKEELKKLQEKERLEKLEEEKLEEEELGEEQDFAPQNPAPEEKEKKEVFDLEKKEIIIRTKKNELKDEGLTNFNDFKTNLKEFSLVKATGSIVKILWSGVKIIYNDYIKGDEKVEKLYYFEIFKETADKYESRNTDTYILIHGYKSEPEQWAYKMASTIIKIKPNSQIILLNWKEVAENLNIKANAKKIKEVSFNLTETLTDWKLKKNETIIMGHSLGTILGSQISQDLGGVKELIALDPASVFNYGLDSFEESMASLTRCFVGEDSILGDEHLASTCDKKYLMDFNKNISTIPEHSATVEQYRKIIAGEYFSKNNYLKLDNNNDIFSESFERLMVNNKFNGVIDILVKKEIKDSKIEITEIKPNHLKIKKGNDLMYYGTEKDNEFICKDKELCNIYSYMGNDIFKTVIKKDPFVGPENNIYSNSYVIKDFDRKNDKIIFNKEFRKLGDSSWLDDVQNLRLKKQTQNSTLLFKYFVGEREIAIEDVSLGDVEGWLSIADGSYRETEEGEKLSEDYWKKLQKDNPIQIK